MSNSKKTTTYAVICATALIAGIIAYTMTTEPAKKAVRKKDYERKMKIDSGGGFDL